MVPLPTTHLRAVRGDPQERALWRRALADAALGPLTVLKAADATTVYAATLDARPVVLKVTRLHSLAHRAYAAMRSTRGSRQWRGTRRLHALGIHAPRCLALVRGRAAEALVEVLIMERLAGCTLLQHLARPTLPIAAQHRTAEALAGLCATMLRAGWFNRDPKPSNVMLLDPPHDTPPHDAPTLAFLDAVAIRPLPPHRRGPLHVPLERLVLEAIGIGAPPRRTLVARFVRSWVRATGHAPGDPQSQRLARRAVWAEVARRIMLAPDPTPTDSPLPAVD